MWQCITANGPYAQRKKKNSEVQDISSALNNETMMVGEQSGDLCQEIPSSKLHSFFFFHLFLLVGG